MITADLDETKDGLDKCCKGRASALNPYHMISASQLQEIDFCLEGIEEYTTPLRPIQRRTEISGHAPRQTIYMFYRKYPEPVRVYIGQSFFGRERIINQIRHRKWATHVVSLGMDGYLRRGTLRLLETCVLRRGLKTFPGALWHNEQGLFVRSPDPFSKTQPHQLDALVSKVLEAFGKALPGCVLAPLETYPVTHKLGGHGDEFYGLLSQRGRSAVLLKGSRISARARNITTLRAIGGTGWHHGSRLDLEGKIERRRETQKRPAGLIITEPVKFADRRVIAEFLTLDDPRFRESWCRVETDHRM